MADLRHLLAIYVHAHQTGNSVPPHIDAEARATLAAEPTFIASEPSDEDLADLSEVFNGDPIPAMRRALELWGRPTISALAAEPPEPAEPDTDAVLTLAAIIRESAGNGLPGAARLAELILSHPNVAKVFQPPAPAPAADGERDHVPGAGNVVPAAYAARLRQCPTHGQLPANAWGCPECLRELREELARLRPPAADGEREELAADLDECADSCVLAEKHNWAQHMRRAAALLREARPQPVPVAERPWDRPGWCDAEGRCWMCDPGDEGLIQSWWYCRHGAPSMTVSLPHWAIPVPQPPQGGEVEQ